MEEKSGGNLDDESIMGATKSTGAGVQRTD